jgi:hypothetical protein
MVTLPHLASAEIDVAKLRGYCLSASHPRGRHKARLFQSALGVTAEDAEWLRRALLAALPRHEAEWQEMDQYGERWSADLALTRQGRRAVVRTIWMIRTGETAARLVSCWVL